MAADSKNELSDDEIRKILRDKKRGYLTLKIFRVSITIEDVWLFTQDEAAQTPGFADRRSSVF
ncbi:MAG: hypothetical protein JSW45_12865 [Thiotrichales bacterium]|nr:MAG: hypothetical protein JSW45_12865 [Thiotrichales bacterium]